VGLSSDAPKPPADGPGDPGDSPPRKFSTDEFKPRDRWEAFCAVVDKFVAADITECFANDFQGEFASRMAGDVCIARSASSPGRWLRTRRSLLNYEESIVLNLQQRGHARQIMGDQVFELRPGTVFLNPTNIRSERQVVEFQHRLSVKLPRAVVETALPPGRLVGPTLFQPDDPIIGLLINYVECYFQGSSNIGTRAEQVAGKHIADLVALAVGASRDNQAEIADHSLKTVRIDAILNAIAGKFASPFVSPAAIGASVGISERHLHRLLEETNRSFYEHLLEARLCHAFQLLTDPGRDIRPIAQIASESGFTNVSYFNRVFRQRFGDTPSGVRTGRGERPA